MGVHVVPLESLNALAWTLFSVAALFTFGRFYLRWRKAHRLYWDDLFNALALASLLIFFVTYQVYFPPQYNYQLYALGLGGYVPDHDTLAFSNRVNEVNVVFFWVTIYCVKGSFLSLYWVIFAVSRKFKIAWIIVTGFTVISFLATFLAFFWSCGTPGKISDVDACSEIPESLLIGITALWIVLNIVGDFMIMALPIWMLRGLHITLSQKIGLAAIAALVLIDIMFDILRTVFTLKSYNSSFPNANAVWDLCEPAIAVMVCALPTYRSLLSQKKTATTTSYEGFGLTKNTGKTDSRTATIPREMDDMSGYSLRSTTSQSALGRQHREHV